MWSIDTPQCYESRKIKYLIPRYTRGRGLEIGCGTEKAYPHFIGVDNGHHFGRGAADVVSEGDDLSMFADESMDFVFSSHCLEHFEDMEKTLAEWARVIKPGGYLVLYVPSANLYPKCGEEGANPDHKHDIYPGDIEKMLTGFCPVRQQERGDGDEYSLFEVYRKGDSEFSEPKGKTACVVRFGGFGDMLQTASILPQLKAQGYHITVMTTPGGRNIIEHDPNVDDWYMLDQDQVPNHELSDFFLAQSTEFDRFVNLCESIEGTLLALPGRPNHQWSKEARHKMMNRNYHEWTAELAGVQFKPCRLFYATEEEEAWARETVNPDEFTIMWALAGSSVHKFSPWQDAVVARIMLDMPEARVIFTGDDLCRILEVGWENEKRVTPLSGEISIRKSLALAQAVPCVIGPETGILNAVAFDANVSKVVMLSHSSEHNLTKHFVKTQTLAPKDCDCFPCHRLHYGNEFCHTDEETGAAMCAKKISAADIYDAIHKVYANWKKRR